MIAGLLEAPRSHEHYNAFGDRDRYHRPAHRRRRWGTCRCAVACLAFKCRACGWETPWCNGGADCASDAHDSETCPHTPKCSGVCSRCFNARMSTEPAVEDDDTPGMDAGGDQVIGNDDVGLDEDGEPTDAGSVTAPTARARP